MKDFDRDVVWRIGVRRVIRVCKGRVLYQKNILGNISSASIDRERDISIDADFIDRIAAIPLESNNTTSSRMKHIILKHNHMRELVRDGIIRTEHVSSREQNSDTLTKALTRETQRRMVKQWNHILEIYHRFRPPSANY